MKIRLIMNDVIAIDEMCTIKEAATLMKQHDIGCIIVTVDSEPRGILTERDIAHELAQDVLYLEKPVNQLMTDGLITIDAEEHISEAARLMVQKGIKKLPVTVDGKVHGILTDTDLVRKAVANELFKALD